MHKVKLYSIGKEKAGMKYSILIPVYNVKPYIRQCLESVLMQKIQDYEVIMVNDGSTDGSEKICEDFVERDSRFQLIHQKNMGLLIARRTAIKEAKGSYFMFLDSDDFWEPDTLEVVDENIELLHPDILIFNFQKYHSDGTVVQREPILQNYEKFDYSNKNKYVLKWLQVPDLNAMWTKVVKRECVDVENGYSKYEGLSSGEDCLQSIYFVKTADSIFYIDKAIYNYRVNYSSISFTYKPQKIEQLHQVKGELFSYISEYFPEDTEIKTAFWNLYGINLGSSLLDLFSNLDTETVRQWIKYVNRQELFQKMLSQPTMPQISTFYKMLISIVKSEHVISGVLLGKCFRVYKKIRRK